MRPVFGWRVAERTFGSFALTAAALVLVALFANVGGAAASGLPGGHSGGRPTHICELIRHLARDNCRCR